MHLIRHAMTAANERKLYFGSTDLPLSDAGVKKLLDKKAGGGYPPPRACRLMTSGMKRTEETFAILYGKLPHEKVKALREMDFGDFEMCSYEDLASLRSYQDWISGDNYANKCPNGESAYEALERALKVVDELLSGERDVIMITHGGIIAGIMEHFFPNEGKNRYQWQPEPSEGYTVTIYGKEPDAYFPIPIR